MMAVHAFRLESGERATLDADCGTVELIVEGETHLVLSWRDIALLQGLLALLAGQAAVKEVG